MRWRPAESGASRQRLDRAVRGAAGAARTSEGIGERATVADRTCEVAFDCAQWPQRRRPNFTMLNITSSAHSAKPPFDAALAPCVAPNEASTGVALVDWDDLFRAVRERLRRAVDDWIAATTEQQLQATAGLLRATVIECVTALDQLHLTLAHEGSRSHRLEREVFDARNVLALARAQLVETRAGDQRTRHLALHDGLTLLPNRGFFHERLQHALAQVEAQQRGLALLYLDLDGFKTINEAHGHAVGDEVLRMVAARLTRAVRDVDMVGRLGGDEFGCLLSAAPDREQLSQLACELLDTVSAPLKIGKLRLSVRPSIGISVGLRPGADAAGLLKTADVAMARAKRERLGYAFFDDAFRIEAPPSTCAAGPAGSAN